MPGRRVGSDSERYFELAAPLEELGVDVLDDDDEVDSDFEDVLSDFELDDELEPFDFDSPLFGVDE